MTIILLIIVVAGLILLLKSRMVRGVKVRVVEIPAIFEKLKATGKDANFAAFAFVPPGRTSAQQAINVQFSIERGKIGFDWVLMGEPNVQDKTKFEQFAVQHGYVASEEEMNRVRYLRIENGDLPALCQAVIRDLYAMPPEAQLDLIPQGFKWP